MKVYWIPTNKTKGIDSFEIIGDLNNYKWIGGWGASKVNFEENEVEQLFNAHCKRCNLDVVDGVINFPIGRKGDVKGYCLIENHPSGKTYRFVFVAQISKTEAHQYNLEFGNERIDGYKFKSFAAVTRSRNYSDCCNLGLGLRTGSNTQISEIYEVDDPKPFLKVIKGS